MWWDSAIFELAGLEFGHARGRLRTFGWDVGVAGYRALDVDRPGGAGRILGRELAVAPSWTLAVRTLAGDEVGAQAAVAELVQAWEPPSRPLATVPLRYRLAGRWRRVYGRPRGVALPTTDVLVHRGRADITCTFDLSHPSHFSDSLRQVVLGVAPASSHGLVFPATPPFSWASMTGEPVVRDLVAGGDAPSPLSVTFRGPVSRPWVQVGDVRVQVTGDLAYDEAVTIDALAGTITRQDGAAWPSMLSPATRLADLWVAPGVHEVMFGGVDVTGTATATIAWRDAWRSL